MSIRIDLAAYDDRGNLRVVVEIKARPSGGREWAEQYRRNLLAHAALPDAPYFVIVTQDTLFLWESAGGHESSAVTIPTEDLFKHYIESNGRNLLPLGDEALTLVATAWLWDLTRNPSVDQRLHGIADALRHGSVRAEVAA